MHLDVTRSLQCSCELLSSAGSSFDEDAVDALVRSSARCNERSHSFNFSRRILHRQRHHDVETCVGSSAMPNRKLATSRHLRNRKRCETWIGTAADGRAGQTDGSDGGTDGQTSGQTDGSGRKRTGTRTGTRTDRDPHRPRPSVSERVRACPRVSVRVRPCPTPVSVCVRSCPSVSVRVRPCPSVSVRVRPCPSVSVLVSHGNPCPSVRACPAMSLHFCPCSSVSVRVPPCLRRTWKDRHARKNKDAHGRTDTD